MRGLVFFLVFISSLPLTFINPFNGVLTWYVFSLGNFHQLTWGFFSNLYYGYIIAIATCSSWMISREKKQLPLTPLVVLTLLLAMWITITSLFAAASLAEYPGHVAEIWTRWTIVEKMLFMCLVGYALTTTRERVNQLIWVVVLSIGVWGVKGGVWSLLHAGAGRIRGPEGTEIGDNNDFGLALIILLPLLFYLWQRTENRNIRRGLVVMSFLVIQAALFTYSRGALLGLCAMGAVTWLRSRAKLATGVLIIVVGLFGYAFVPPQWFNRMDTIETYQDDASAMARIYMWQVGLQIAREHPIVGGGFKASLYPVTVNPLLHGIPEMTTGRAEHSIYFDVLSEHGWVGLALFLMIAGYSWLNCSRLIRQSAGRPELAWANLLGRMGQATLVGYWTAGAFLSQSFLDEYWGVIFIFDAARRVVAAEIASPAGASAAVPSVRLRAPQGGIATGALPKPGVRSR
jgi:putative inorganic carbon (hco3(-)) transporter